MRNHWYVAAEDRELRERPLARQILGEPIALFRGPQGVPAALADICPHRHVQLSGGTVRAGRLACPYHGWEFGPAGRCEAIPSLCAGEAIPAAAATAVYPVLEQDGYVWVWVGDRPPGDDKPFALPHRGERGWANARLSATIPNTVDNVIENFIDCSHTGYIHGGLFRTPASHMAKTAIKAVADGVVIDIVEENQVDSLLARLLVAKGSEVTHQDRYIVPSIVQVAYGFGPNKAISGYQICTPVAPFITRVHVYLTWRLGWLTHLLTPLMPRIGRTVLDQDMGVLTNQAEVIQRHGSRFTSVPADTANLWIQACRARLERDGTVPPERETHAEFRL